MLYKAANTDLSKLKKWFTYQYPNIVQIKPPTAKSHDLLTLPERKPEILQKIREKTLDDFPLLIRHNSKKELFFHSK